MVALEIDGQHITFQDSHIRGALLALTSLNALKLAVPHSLELLLKDVRLEGCSTTAAGAPERAEWIERRGTRTVQNFFFVLVSALCMSFLGSHFIREAHGTIKCVALSGYLP